MMAFKLAYLLAYSRDPRQRWRQLSVVCTTAISATLLLLCAGVVHAATVSDARIRARSPVWAPSEADANLLVSLRGLVIGKNEQFPVVWVEPAPGHESDPAIVPPGLRWLPGPGEGVISPGLAVRGFTAKHFGLQPSSAGAGPHGVIGLAGLTTTSEGWIYARPASGRSLGSGGALLPLKGYRGGSSRANLETELQLPTGLAARIGSAWLLLGPALVLLFGGVRSLSQVRDDRAETLFLFGVTPLRIRVLLALETVLLAALGIVPAVVLWLLWLSSVREIPWTDAQMLPSAMAFPAYQVVLVALIILGAAAAGAVVGRIGRDRTQRPPRVVRGWHAVPVIVSISMMVMSRLAPGFSRLSQYLLFGGILLTFVALPLALPVAVVRIGGLLGRSKRPARWVAGRRLSLLAVTLSRPAAAVGLLVFHAGGAFAIYGRMTYVDPSPGVTVPFSRFEVNWRDPRSTDVDYVRAAMSTFVVAPRRADKAMFHDCLELSGVAKSLSLVPCDSAGALTKEFSREFKHLTYLTPVIEHRLPRVGDDNELLLLGAASATSRQVMSELAGTLPAVNISQIGRPTVPGIKPNWLVVGWLLASLTLCAVLLREVGDRALGSLNEDARLWRLGMTATEINSIQRWSLLPPVAAAIPIGYVGAISFALFGFYLDVTVNYVGRITIVALAVGGMATISLGLAFHVHHRALGGKSSK